MCIRDRDPVKAGKALANFRTEVKNLSKEDRKILNTMSPGILKTANIETAYKIEALSNRKKSVSYTHLDVYKRQTQKRSIQIPINEITNKTPEEAAEVILQVVNQNPDLKTKGLDKITPRLKPAALKDFELGNVCLLYTSRCV